MEKSVPFIKLETIEEHSLDSRRMLELSKRASFSFLESEEVVPVERLTVPYQQCRFQSLRFGFYMLDNEFEMLEKLIFESIKRQITPQIIENENKLQEFQLEMMNIVEYKKRARLELQLVNEERDHYKNLWVVKVRNFFKWLLYDIVPD